MYRIGDQPSKTDLHHITSSSEHDTNIDECIRNIQNNIEMLYQTEPRDEFHLGSYGVNANSYFATHIPQSSNNKLKHSGYTTDFVQDNYFSNPNDQIVEMNEEISEQKNSRTQNQLDPYSQRLAKENQDLLNQKIKLEAQNDLLSQKMKQMEFGFNEKDQIILQLQDQIRSERNKQADRDDKLSFSFNKVDILKQQIESQFSKIKELEQNEIQYQQSIQTIQQQNERFKQMIEDLQNEINRRVKKKENENAHIEQEYQKLIDLLKDVMQTVGQFVVKYNDQMDQLEPSIKQSNELKRILYTFGETNRQLSQNNTAVQDIEKLSQLTISLFEQIQLTYTTIKQENKKKQQLQQQIISLEEMTVNLEKQLVQYECQYNELEKYLKISDQQTQKEKFELVETLMKQVQDENQGRNLGKVIQNLEDLNYQLQGDLQRLEEELRNKQEELMNSRQLIIEEQNRAQFQEFRVKKLYQDNLFARDLIQKLCSLLANEEVNQIIEAMLDIQKEISVIMKDQLEIKGQLELQENQLKKQIQEGLTKIK